jgi:hypothetical protein
MKAIGPSFTAELRAAGLLGLPFTWGADGAINFHPDMTPQQISAVQAVYSEHDPEAAPPVEVPKAVTMRQARLALLQAGMLQTVNQAVASMPGDAGEAARIEWEYSQEVQRDKQLVLALAPVLGLNEAQLDALFIAAAAL